VGGKARQGLAGKPTEIAAAELLIRNSVASKS